MGDLLWDTLRTLNRWLPPLTHYEVEFERPSYGDVCDLIDGKQPPPEEDIQKVMSGKIDAMLARHMKGGVTRETV